jgi:phosphoribosylaminoimidazole-succinocarboxamide synthase
VQVEWQKGSLMYTGVGYEIWSTDDDAHAIMEWTDECACRLSYLFHKALKRHALATNALERLGPHSLVVSRLQPLPLGLVVRATANNAELQMLGAEDLVLERSEAEAVPGVKPTRLPVMEDVALHTARTLRAYLLKEGVEELELRLAFGIAPSGECQLQAINPAECRLGSTDYHSLCDRFEGGDER